MNVRPPSDLLLQADVAERNGDRATAVAKLRAYLNTPAREPAATTPPAQAQAGGQAQARGQPPGRPPHSTVRADDGPVRLRLARLLMALDEPSSARSVLLPLDDGPNAQAPDAPDWASQANRLLAALDEADGALTSAQIRWERVLADDIDDAEARSHLRLLQPRQEPEGWPGTLSVGTLAVPDGVRLSRFRMIRELGRGSTAAVYLVRDERLDLPLALKVLHPQLAAATRTEARERFFAEARLAARLRHPGVVAIYGIDEEARCLAMEYVAGGTIRDRVRDTKRTGGHAARPTAEGEPRATAPHLVLEIARSLMAALAYVHAAGIVHGDLKPGNVLLRTATEVVLADFGVAALAAQSSAALADRTAGTPLYLAPEQFRGAPAAPQTDLFAAGAILWELLHGTPARSQADLLAGQYGAPPRSPAGDPPPLSRLITALLAPAPEQRPASAQAALSALNALSAGA